MSTEKPYVIRVGVVSHYLPEHSAPAHDRYTFAYTITLTNLGSVPAQLIARHWLIEDAAGHSHEVKGLGVVGQQPLLRPGESFEYTSSSQIKTPTGRMHGSYFFVAENGTRFDAAIPAFELVMPRQLH